VTFLGDGTAQVAADCNRAGGGYSVGPVGGAHGVVDIALGPMTAAECGPGSRSLDFVRGLDAAHDYRVQPGGAQLALELLDGTRLLLAAAITDAMLKNMEYHTTVLPSGTVTLANGEYRQPAAPGSATEVVVTLIDPIAYGTLNGQPAAAVVLVTEPGGSGAFSELAVVQLQNGRPVNVATTPLGDRVTVEAVAIQNEQIVVDMVVHAPADPLCCPTQRVRVTYELRGDHLVETARQPVASTP
jgi:hypothetical protein